MLTVLYNAFAAVEWFLILFWAYWFFIRLFGFGKPKHIRNISPQTRFALFIPAHNEENVIKQLIENLSHLDYPKELYDIYVIADNCTDDTALISMESGALVFEHYSSSFEPKGKPYAIKCAIDQMGDRLGELYNAVAIFDADNLVSLNYLTTMNNHFVKGDKLVQCYLDSKNPNDNWITLSYATSYYYMNRSWQLGKSRLRLGNAIGGTGFCVSTRLLKEVGWTARSLTEDLEFTMQCLLRGEYAKWNHEARVYDEKPLGFAASALQRLRWARGHWDVCFKYILPLLYRTIRHADIRAFDGALYLLNPGKIVLGTVTGLILLTRWFLPVAFIRAPIPWWTWIFALGFNFSYVAATIVFDSRRRINIPKALISLFAFNYTYVPLFVWAFFTARNRKWKRTDHTRAIDLDSIEQDDAYNGIVDVAATVEK